jgi:hypothetical protein
MAATPPPRVDSDDERDLLVALLNHTEAASAASPRDRQARKAAAACLAALQWCDRRQEGASALLWGSGGIARGYALVIFLGAAANVSFGRRPLTLIYALEEFLLVLVFGVGGGALIGRLAWRASEKNYHRQLERARTLPTASPQPALRGGHVAAT